VGAVVFFFVNWALIKKNLLSLHVISNESIIIFFDVQTYVAIDTYLIIKKYKSPKKMLKKKLKNVETSIYIQ